MVDYRKCWVSVVSGGGGGVSVIVGGGIYYLSFFNVAQPSNWLHCIVGAGRLGVVAHAGASHAIGLMVGVGGEDDVHGLTGGGWDFAVDIGAKWGSMLKAGSKVEKALDTLKALSKAKGTVKGESLSEAGKALVNGFRGNFDLDDKNRGFYLFGTPAGVGIGAGVWYEWQRVSALGGADAWNFGKPKWRIVKHNGELWLQMKDIPEKDGVDIFLDFREEAWGRDSTLEITEPSSVGPSTVISGVVRNYTLHEQSYNAINNAPRGGGLNLTRRTLSGRTEVHGWWDMKVVTKKLPNQSVNIGLTVTAHLKKVWETDDYAKFKTDASGDLTQVLNANTWLE